jgi:hypothetical protein
LARFVVVGCQAGAAPENPLLYFKSRQQDRKKHHQFSVDREKRGNAMTHHPIDVATRVSPRLSELLRGRINDPDCEQPITLMVARRFLVDLLPADFREAERLHHFDVDASLLDEMDALIEEFGEGALAVDFVQSHASEQLSRVIESLVNDENRENPPTLSAVKDAIVSGLGVRLVGEGVLDEDEDDTLLSEIESLIEQFGADALAEDFLRYE